jgi:hypothetical protein
MYDATFELTLRARIARTDADDDMNRGRGVVACDLDRRGRRARSLGKRRDGNRREPVARSCGLLDFDKG